MTRLGSLSWTELAAAPRRVLVVPLGSCEQHGPHLPLDTDARLAEAVAHAAAEGIGSVVVAPTLAVGASGEHAEFPGTLSIGTEVLAAVVVELVRSADATADVVVVVNGHGGNADALAAAEATCRAEGRRLVVHHLRPGGDAHAGRTETSLLLAVAPESVRLERAEAGATAPLAELADRLRRHGVASVSPNGVLGDPAGAGAAEGRELLAALVADARAVLSAL